MKRGPASSGQLLALPTDENSLVIQKSSPGAPKFKESDGNQGLVTHPARSSHSLQPVYTCLCVCVCDRSSLRTFPGFRPKTDGRLTPSLSPPPRKISHRAKKLLEWSNASSDGKGGGGVEANRRRRPAHGMKIHCQSVFSPPTECLVPLKICFIYLGKNT